MQKVLGAVFVITGFLGMGYFYIDREKEKIKFIDMWDNVLSMFINEIAYKKQSLTFATYEIGQKMEGKVGQRFQKVHQRMTDQNREGFAEIWKEEWQNYIKNNKNYQKERKLIEEFAYLTGFEDEEVMIKMIEEQQRKWRSLRTEVMEGQQERKKMVWTLSICFSLMLILILL